MKLKKGFVKKLIMDEYVVVSTGDLADKFSGLIKLNETGSFIWDSLERDTSSNQIADNLSKKYGIDLESAKHDVDDFICKLKEAGCLDD